MMIFSENFKRMRSIFLISFISGASYLYAGTPTDSPSQTAAMGDPTRFSAAAEHPNCTFFDGFADNGDGTLTDPRSGLIWKRCVEGAEWNGTSCSSSLLNLNWYEAANHARNSHFLGKSDWRLPSKNEFQTIMGTGAQCKDLITRKYGREGDPIKIDHAVSKLFDYPLMQLRYIKVLRQYWTASEVSQQGFIQTGEAYIADFDNAGFNFRWRNGQSEYEKDLVRLVRAGGVELETSEFQQQFDKWTGKLRQLELAKKAEQEKQEALVLAEKQRKIDAQLAEEKRNADIRAAEEKRLNDAKVAEEQRVSAERAAEAKCLKTPSCRKKKEEAELVDAAKKAAYERDCVPKIQACMSGCENFIGDGGGSFFGGLTASVMIRTCKQNCLNTCSSGSIGGVLGKINQMNADNTTTQKADETKPQETKNTTGKTYRCKVYCKSTSGAITWKEVQASNRKEAAHMVGDSADEICHNVGLAYASAKAYSEQQCSEK